MKRIKTIINGKETICKIVSTYNNGTMRIEFACYDSDGIYCGEQEKTVLPKYSIIHHSEMTDCNLYFIADSKSILLENEKTINEFMASDFDNAEKIFTNLGIEYKHEEYDEIPDFLIVLKKYSYRF